MSAIKMRNSTTFKPRVLSSIIVSIIIVLDGSSALLIGLLILVLAGLGDPPGESLAIKYEIERQGMIVALITLVYLIFCLISLIYWNRGKHSWEYGLLGLALLHLVGSGFLITDRVEFGFIVPLFFASLILNLLVILIVILEKRNEMLFAQNIST